MAVTRLKLIRMNRGLSQREVAKKLCISRPWYTLIEGGRLIPSNEVKSRLNEMFGEPSEELLQPIILQGQLNKGGA